MNSKEYAFTASEITQLEYILSIMPASREIQRIGLEHRLRKARERLEGVPIPPKPKSVYAHFQGEPVIDGVGIDANFAGKVTRGFAESTAITTAGATGRLHDTGGIPHRGLGLQIPRRGDQGVLRFRDRTAAPQRRTKDAWGKPPTPRKERWR